MKKRLLMVIVLGAIALPVAAFASPGGAAAQPQPTMVITPSSGPCDGTLEVRGSLSPDQDEVLVVYLVQPGTADISMDLLNEGMSLLYGQFGGEAPLWERGCEAAALDSQSQQPTGRLSIALSLISLKGRPVQPGERIPNVIAVAEYTYTTTTASRPEPTMVITPSSGPCDATVEVTLTGADPSIPVSFDIGRPHASASMGTVATATTDTSGEFRGQLELGDLGCEAASFDALLDAPGDPKEIFIAAQYQPERRSLIAQAPYTYTTTKRGATLPPQGLPNTGAGSSAREPRVVIAVTALAAAAAGLLLVVAALYGGGRRP